MEFQNAQHKQLHELLIQLGFNIISDKMWNYFYQDEGGNEIYFDKVEDYSIRSHQECSIDCGMVYLENLKLSDVLTTLQSLLPSDATPTEQADTEECEQLHELLIEVGYTDVGAPNWKHYYQDATGNKLYFNDAVDYQICGSIIHPLRGIKMYLKKLSLTQILDVLRSPSYAELVADYKQVEDTEQVDTANTKQLAHTGLITVCTIAEALRNHPNATNNASNTIFSFHSGTTVMINGASMKHKYGVANNDTGMATNDFAQFLGWLLDYGICLVETIDFNAELAKLGFVDNLHRCGITYNERCMEIEWKHDIYDITHTQATIDAIKLAIEAETAINTAEAALCKLAG